MSDFLIDTSFIACPQPDQDASKILAYVDNLSNLYSLNDSESLKLYLSSQSLNELTEANLTPPYEKTEIDYYVQREDITKLFYGIIKKVEYLEDKVSIVEVLFDNCTCNPSHHLSDRHKLLIKSYHRINAILAISIHLGVIDTSIIILTNGINGSEKIKSKGEIHDVEFLKSAKIRLPFFYEINLLNVDNYEELLANIDPKKLWLKNHFKRAIELSVFQKKPDFVNNQLWPNFSLDFKFHKQFIKSCESLGFTTTESKIEALLRACTETILNEQLSDTHAIREKKKGGANQLVRSKDNASAWRRDIDYEFHLHYWKIGEMIEFASVVPHNDFTIPE